MGPNKAHLSRQLSESAGLPAKFLVTASRGGSATCSVDTRRSASVLSSRGQGPLTSLAVQGSPQAPRRQRKGSIWAA